MTDQTWEDLEAFAREELGRPLFGRLELTPESRIEEDLRLTGVDAVEFIDAWAEKFKIETPGGFPYARYFGPDSLDVVRAVAGLFSRKFRDAPLVPITLGMLAEAMRRGRWDTEEIEATNPRN
jgi:acyl carrier protein